MICLHKAMQAIQGHKDQPGCCTELEEGMQLKLGPILFTHDDFF